jgi:ABC-2 type transport system permease protein
LLVTLVGVAFGAFALKLCAGTGRARLAVYVTVGVALVTNGLNAFKDYSDALVGYAKWSPFYYYLTSDPLFNGMNWRHGAVLAGLAIALIALAIVLFNRRDLRQTG